MSVGFAGVGRGQFVVIGGLGRVIRGADEVTHGGHLPVAECGAT